MATEEKDVTITVPAGKTMMHFFVNDAIVPDLKDCFAARTQDEKDQEGNSLLTVAQRCKKGIKKLIRFTYQDYKEQLARNAAMPVIANDVIS
jgi:hypothetical protein